MFTSCDGIISFYSFARGDIAISKWITPRARFDRSGLTRGGWIAHDILLTHPFPISFIWQTRCDFEWNWVAWCSWCRYNFHQYYDEMGLIQFNLTHSMIPISSSGYGQTQWNEWMAFGRYVWPPMGLSLLHHDRITGDDNLILRLGMSHGHSASEPSLVTRTKSDMPYWIEVTKSSVSECGAPYTIEAQDSAQKENNTIYNYLELTDMMETPWSLLTFLEFRSLVTTSGFKKLQSNRNSIGLIARTNQLMNKFERRTAESKHLI